MAQDRGDIELRAHRQIGGERTASGEIDALAKVGEGIERRALPRIAVQAFALRRRPLAKRPLLFRERHFPAGARTGPSPPIRSRYHSTN